MAQDKKTDQISTIGQAMNPGTEEETVDNSGNTDDGKKQSDQKSLRFIIPKDVHKKMRELSYRKEISFQKMLEEGLNLWLLKMNEKPIAWEIEKQKIKSK